jgi:hypothetical protein
MSEADAAVVLNVYDRMVRPNFVPWMARVWTTVRSKTAGDACEENLLCEIREDHPYMLMRFACQTEKRAHWTEIAGRVEAGVAVPMVMRVTEAIWTSEIAGLWVMAALERSSLVFMPWMRLAGEGLRFSDFTYLDKHGEADQDHAEQFARAIVAEMVQRQMDAVPGSVQECEALFLTYEFLKQIFTSGAH